jgi:hypothetical protein
LQEALRTEAKHELFIIDDVQTFKSILKACHNEIRNNEGYDATIALMKWRRFSLQIIWEKHSTGNRFNLSIFNESLESLGVNVVKQIFEETKKDARYSGLFASETAIDLSDRTIKKGSIIV